MCPLVFVSYRQKETEADREKGVDRSKVISKNMFSISAFTVPAGKWREKCQTVQYTDEDTDEHRKVEHSVRNTSVA